MFLDRELREIRKAKENLAMRCEFRRSLFRLDLLPLKSRVREAVSAWRAGVAAARLAKDLLAGRRDRDR
jgi:hypothetical protein